MGEFVKRIVSLLLVACFIFPVAASAANESLTVAGKKTKVVAKAAIYGAGGGLVVGLASQVFKKKSKNIFLFGSLGLYAGILTGLYVISTSHSAVPYEGPDTYEDYGDFSLKPVDSSFLMAKQAPKAEELKVNFVDVTF